MLLKSVTEALLIPPVSLLLLAILGLLIERRHQRVGRLLAWSGLIGLLLTAMPVVSGGLLQTLEYGLPLVPPADAPPQAIVVLGGDIARGGEDTIILQPGLLSLDRERGGAALYRRTQLPILISGGPLLPGDSPLSHVMADSMEHDFGVPVQWTETRSQDTWTNAEFSAEILRQQGIRSVYVVTQAWHMRRALLAFAHTGITATAAPTRIDHLAVPFIRLFVPDVQSWVGTYYVMHEWIGCAYYALR